MQSEDNRVPDDRPDRVPGSRPAISDGSDASAPADGVTEEIDTEALDVGGIGAEAIDDEGIDPDVRSALLRQCEERIGYVFRDKRLLISALTHASGADHRLASNERLEFLGDAILGFVVCEQLFHRFPDFLEGDLTRIKSAVVSRQTCARVSEEMKLYDFLIVGKGMATGTQIPNSLLADVFESLLAAIYLDGGDAPARAFIEVSMAKELEAAGEAGIADNYKSALQQLVQRDYGTTPSYHVVDERGPDHSKVFHVSARVAGRSFLPAWGRSKKEAEQRAAQLALEQLVNERELESDGDDSLPFTD